MSEELFQTKKSSKTVECAKCKKRRATGDDLLCDSCRYMFTLETIVTAGK